MSDIDDMKVRILIALNWHGNRDEFLSGDFYLAPSDLPEWDSAEKYDTFWEAVYNLRDMGLVHVRYEPNANMLALTDKGHAAVKRITEIANGRGE